MPDTPSFVVNDRRKFTADGDLRPDTVPPAPANSENAAGPQLVSPESAAPAATTAELVDLPESSSFQAMEPPLDSGDLTSEEEAAFHDLESTFAPGPTEEQSLEATRAYDATVERLDTALRAADPGADRLPEMTFERLTQSLYTQALLLLGGAAQPGETPRVDILGARQTIDMLVILAEKTKGNLAENEDKLLQSALFDLRMGFLEITQALARQARQSAGAAAPGSPFAGGGAGPRIVR